MTKKTFMKIAYPCTALLLIMITGGCATPVGVTSLGMDSGYKQIDRCALNSDKYSSNTAAVLHRHGLKDLYEDTPVSSLQQLHALACSDDREDVLFALAELSFLMGKEDRSDRVDGNELTSKNYFTASAIYAYLFLARLEEGNPMAAFDRRFRLACDLYNRSLGYIIAQRKKGAANQIATQIWLPVGSIRLQLGLTDLPLPLSEYVDVLSADHFKVNGLSVRNRIAGMGTPLVLVSEQTTENGIIPKGYAATAFVRIHGTLQDFTTGTLVGDIDAFSPTYPSSIVVDGRTIPLERDITTAIAFSLTHPLLWQMESSLFRFGKSFAEAGIYQPYPQKSGQIPVLWVHGTMSSPVWWAEMWNTLMADPTLRENYQHWFYLYDSGKPVVHSYLHLRKSIEDFVKARDPEGKDPALRQMVVIGHSQGGLLTKATAIETDSEALIRTVTGKSLKELDLAPEEEKLIRSYTQLTPLPPVKRVVFISTPHRGSFLANGLTRQLVKWFINIPVQSMQATAELMRIIPGKSQVSVAATSLDSMSPQNPSLLAFAEIPVSPSIKAHSIIAINGDDIPPEGDDGVVAYSSAHITGVESELVVRSGHSCQSNPKTIEEVRRILREHLKTVNPQSK